MVPQAWLTDILANNRHSMKGLHRMSYLDLVLCRTLVEDIFYIYKYRYSQGIVILLILFQFLIDTGHFFY